jgi:mono/diheme cytochrome c family protein
MTRAIRAQALAAATALLVVALAALFAALRNRGPTQPAPPAAATAAVVVADAASEAGRRAFEKLNCGMCHSLGGRGNTDSPLDGIGARRDRAAIREWATGTGAARDELPAGIVRRKARYLNDPDLETVVEYLSRLK